MRWLVLIPRPQLGQNFAHCRLPGATPKRSLHRHARTSVLTAPWAASCTKARRMPIVRLWVTPSPFGPGRTLFRTDAPRQRPRRPKTIISSMLVRTPISSKRDSVSFLRTSSAMANGRLRSTMLLPGITSPGIKAPCSRNPFAMDITTIPPCRTILCASRIALVRSKYDD